MLLVEGGRKGRKGRRSRRGKGKERGNQRERGVNRLHKQEREDMHTCYTLAMTLFYPTLYYMKCVLSYHGVDQAWLLQKNRSTTCLLPSAAPAQN